MKTAAILATSTLLMLNLGCSPSQEVHSQQVVSIIEVPMTPVNEWVASDEIIDQIEEEEDLAPNSLLSWTPNATRGRETEPECRLDALRTTLKSTSNTSTQEFTKKMEAYFQKCEESLARGAGLGLLRDLKMATLRYEVANSPHIKEVEVKFANGYKVRGLLALQPDQIRRPLIIARCGVFCDIADRLPRTLLMHLFDESPFNVLVLASTTGENFAEDNSEFGIGGYLEASQHLKLAEFVRSGRFNFAHLISSVHVFGGSLGGNSAVLTALLADSNRDSLGQSPINSVWAHCPVVNLKDTLEEVLRPSLKGYFMARSANKVLEKVYEGRGSIFEKIRGPAAILEVVKTEAHLNYSHYFLNEADRFLPFSENSFTSIDDVWNVNQFSSLAQNVRTPLIAFAAEDDWIVETNINTAKLQNELSKTVNHDVSTFVLPEGRHCAQGLVYGWSTMSELYRSYFLSHSPEFADAERSVSSLLDVRSFPSRLSRLGSDEWHFAQEWSVSRSAEMAELEFQIWSPRAQSRCSQLGPYRAPESCFRRVEIEVPLAIFRAYGMARIPSTETEAQAISRWLNSNVTVLTEGGAPLHHTDHPPYQLSWLAYQ